MKKYDGPAFYRQNDKKQNNPKKTFKELQANLSKKNNYASSYNSRGFHPTFFPPSKGKQNFTSLHDKYAHLIIALDKSSDSYILFQDESKISQRELPLIDLTKSNNEIVIDKENVVSNSSIAEKKAEHFKQSKNVLNQAVESQEKTLVPNNGKVDKNILIEKMASTILNKSLQQEKARIFEKDKIIENKQSMQLNAKPIVKQDQSNQASKFSNVKTENSLLSKRVLIASEKDNLEYQYPSLELLPKPVTSNDSSVNDWVEKQVVKLNEALFSFKVDAKVENWTIGPSIIQFEVKLGRGVKVNKITNLSDDLQLALAVRDVRIEAPIPGKSSVGIEIPNKYARPVNLAEVLSSNEFKNADSPLTVALGVDLFGRPQITNIQKMPHGLIAGATGSGKSVFINSMLISLLYKATPQDVKLILIDPKAVEMAPYQDIPHLLAPVISDPQAASAALKWVVEEMENRYQKLLAAGVRNIEGFNNKVSESQQYGLKMPYIVVIIDELADLMMVAASEVQDYIARITAKARAAGIHLIVATQRPSVDVLTGTIKNNIPTRIAFMVSSQIDSRTILDSAGAERLLGRGDMLYLGNGSGQPIRLQGTFIGDEIDEVTDSVRKQGHPQYAFDPDNLKDKIIEDEQQDELVPRVLDYIVNEKEISTSKLQRVFSIGYNRAASIIDLLEEKQYISKARGSKPRSVFLTQEQLNKLRV
ncbi:DNA translocase FtsK [Ligilactobacillus sp. WILCCON 0076]|uniref:DNA translocase FtsK n=1 Tax=Ligilactobacillus ubinensis TaxID=2876789 RepID=A0A9X2FLV6_9LACO|nr:DNA translocase FtsK [Ligilactobacillus ubinensis]MCP0886743.1 DNA translocase FtsK [Ligilactobacillus ubinensis]